MRATIVIYDPYVSIRYLATRLNNRYELIAVLTPSDIPEQEIASRFHAEVFEQVIQLCENLSKDLLTLKTAFTNKTIIAHLTGYEKNIHYIEQVIASLEPTQANNPKTSKQRDNKAVMQTALEAAGIPGVKQIVLSSAPDETTIDAIIQQLNLPIVVKPTEGSGSMGVSICRDKSSLIKSIASTLHTVGNFNTAINEVTLQQYLHGNEFFVDAASHGGQHYINGIFQYSKIWYQGRSIYHSVNIIRESSELHEACRHYIKQLLPALGMQNGFSHTEIMQTPDGFRLIELNPRLSGAYGTINQVSKGVNGIDQIDALLCLLNQPPLDTHEPKFTHGRIFCLQNFGFEYQAVDLEQIINLASYQSHHLLHSKASRVKVPQHIGDTICFIVLMHNDANQIEEDTQTLIDFEKTGKVFL